MHAEFYAGLVLGAVLGILAAAIWMSVCIVWIDGKRKKCRQPREGNAPTGHSL